MFFPGEIQRAQQRGFFFVFQTQRRGFFQAVFDFDFGDAVFLRPECDGNLQRQNIRDPFRKPCDVPLLHIGMRWDGLGDEGMDDFFP